MAVNQAKALDALVIRDTNAHDGVVIFNGEFIIKTLIVENSLDQAVTFQCMGSAHPDFSNSFNIGSSFEVAATTNIYMTCDTYIPYWRITATCSVAPTDGSVTVTVFEVD